VKPAGAPHLPLLLLFLPLLLYSCAVTAPDRTAGPAGEVAAAADPAAPPDEPFPPEMAIPPAAPEPRQESPADAPAAYAAAVPFTAAPASGNPADQSPALDPDKLILSRLAGYQRLPASRLAALRVFPQDAGIYAASEGSLRKLEPESREKDTAYYLTDAAALLIRAPGYTPLILPVPDDGKTIGAKLEKYDVPLEPAGEAVTGYQPKSVRFAPDGKTMFVTYLGDDTAMSQFSVDPLSKIRDLEVPRSFRADSGFVETVILPGRDEIWLSQMTTNTLHVFSLFGGSHIASIPLSGIWPKVMLADPDERRVYVSCWDSLTVLEIDTSTRKEIRSFKTSGIPRGLAFTPDRKGILAAIYSSTAVDRIDLYTGLVTDTYDAAPGRVHAMRHIVHDRLRGEYYITAMGAGRVYRMSETGEWLGWWAVGEKPNTCVISPDGNYLFVSCRGPNNPDIGYLFKGYEFGRVYVINLKTGESEGWIWGRDQTTGIDMSPDGKYLAFTDFLSRNLELYHVR
jgi:YVTN family beta-propeller protein